MRRGRPWRALERLGCGSGFRAVAAALTGGGGAAVPLAARYNGGRELHDATGHLPRDADGYYLSRTTGERLVIDAGYSVGGEVGPLRMYTAHGVEVGTVTGQPATGRRTGFGSISDANYATLNLSANAYTMIAKVTLSTSLSQDSIIVGAAATGPRWGFYSQPGALVSARLGTSGSPVTLSSISTGSVGTGTRWLAATYDGATDSTSVHCYDDAGALVVRDRDDRAAAFTVSGQYHVGRARGAGVAFTAGSIDVGLGLDGAALSDAAIDAVILALASGATTIDDYAATFSLPTDGLICGAYDAADPTVLYSESGTGAAVTVEQP